MWLTFSSRVVNLAILVPLFLGIAGTLLPAFHYLPALGSSHFDLSPWYGLWQTPELISSLQLSLFSGLIATLLSLLIAFAAVALFYQTGFMRFVNASLAPILAIPHAAIAIGLLFLISPSGWIIRLISPWLTGFERPPNWISVQDPYTLSLVLALVIKETPYLIFVMLAGIKQLQPEAMIRIGLTMGYPPITTWRKVLLPALYPIIRLPLFVVLAFSLTVVDLALIIGPNTPSTFAVTLFRWFNDADLALRFTASAGAILLMLLIAFACWGWEMVYQFTKYFSRKTWCNGKRLTISRYLIQSGGLFYGLLIGLAALAIAILPLWSVAQRWRFPDVLPSSWTMKNIVSSLPLLTELSINTLIIAAISTSLALLSSLVVLEHKKTTKAATSLFDRLIYLPILLPQVGFLFGIQIMLIWSGQNGNFCAVILLHLLYVLPYVYLTLHGPYLAFEQNYYTQALALTRRPLRAFFLVKLAMLKPALFSAFAIGIAVSISQYLPTLIAGEGRISTLTTEAIALAASGERKRVSSMALLQTLFPLLIFMLAQWLPKVWTPFRLRFQIRISQGIALLKRFLLYQS